MDNLPAAEELASLRALATHLRAENARLLRLLELTPKQAAPPGPAQTDFFEAHPGPVHWCGLVRNVSSSSRTVMCALCGGAGTT